MTETTAPTVALVHGAFADSSGWNDVVRQLRAGGVKVKAVSNLLRGIATDSAYVASAFRQIPGPVLAVGHSYGGAIITNAATMVDNVVGLVYVAAFAPDEGETLQDVEGDSRDSVLMTALLQLEYPVGKESETAVEFAIDPARFHDAFAADVPEEEAAVMAATQRPGFRRSASSSRTGRRRGPHCRPGRSSPPVTRPRAATWCDGWPSGPERRSPRSTPPMS
jgi:pimeloyl-ACP methyl ester carboxylesterase